MQGPHSQSSLHSSIVGPAERPSAFAMASAWPAPLGMPPSLGPAVPPPVLPPSPPGSPLDPKVVEFIFAVTCAVLGLAILLAGQRLFKVVLGLLTFLIVGGASGYLLLYHVSAVPIWADVLIASCLGAAISVLAIVGKVLALVVFAGVAAGIVAALCVRLLNPQMQPMARIAIVAATAAIGLLLAAFAAYRCSTGDQEEARQPREERRRRLRARTGRKILESTVTSVLGAYAIIHAINQWWHEGHGEDALRSLQLAALLDPTATLPACTTTTPCVPLIFGCLGMALVGLTFQTCSVCRAHRARRDEQEAMLTQPLDGSRRCDRVGQPTDLSDRMRRKYYGGRAAASAESASSAYASGVAPRPGMRPYQPATISGTLWPSASSPPPPLPPPPSLSDVGGAPLSAVGAAPEPHAPEPPAPPSRSWWWSRSRAAAAPASPEMATMAAVPPAASSATPAADANPNPWAVGSPPPPPPSQGASGWPPPPQSGSVWPPPRGTG